MVIDVLANLIFYFTAYPSAVVDGCGKAVSFHLDFFMMKFVCLLSSFFHCDDS